MNQLTKMAVDQSCNRFQISLIRYLGLSHRFEGTRNVFISLDDAWSDYCSFHQGQHQTLQVYLKNLQTRVQVLVHYGAVFCADGPHQDSVMAQVREDSSYYVLSKDE
jgi:hypothetical protein